MLQRWRSCRQRCDTGRAQDTWHRTDWRRLSWLLSFNLITTHFKHLQSSLWDWSNQQELNCKIGLISGRRVNASQVELDQKLAREEPTSMAGANGHSMGCLGLRGIRQIGRNKRPLSGNTSRNLQATKDWLNQSWQITGLMRCASNKSLI